MLFGFCGYAGAGKDTLAALLIRHNNFERRAFADPMRTMLYHMNPLVVSYTESGQPDLKRVRELVDTYGWDYAKRTSEIRDLLQRLGTEGGRDVLGRDVWVNALFEKPYEDLVITDVRFPNEADEIHNRGGTIVRIIRPDVRPPNSHSSEFSYQDEDQVLYNKGTIFDLYENFKEIYL